MRTTGRYAFAGLIFLLLLAVAGQAVGGKKKGQQSKVVDVSVATGHADTEGSPAGYVDLAEATTQVRAVKDGTILVRFGSESHCFGTRGGYCSVRVLVDGLEASPADEPGTQYDSTGGGGWQSRAIERSAAGVDKGSHTVVVQWGVFGGSDTRFEMGAWHLTVESFR